MLDRAEATQIPEFPDIDVPVVDLVAALAQEITDHVLARPFRAAGRGNRDKIPCGGKLRVETGVDRVEDSLFCVAGTHGVVVPRWRTPQDADAFGSNHSFRGFAVV